MNETLFGDVCADRDRTISTNHCFYLFSKNNFLSIYVKMYVKDFATPCFSPISGKNRLTGNPFFPCSLRRAEFCTSVKMAALGQIPNPGKTEKTVPSGLPMCKLQA